MPKPELFLDSSALIAGVLSPAGAARALLVLAEAGLLRLIVSEQVVAESERALARKAPAALPFYREALRKARLSIRRNPTPAQVRKHLAWVSDPTDVPILVAAMQSAPGYFVTLDRRHLLADPAVARRSGLRIGTPGDTLAWIRSTVGSA